MQELQPAIFLPPPLGGLLKQLACRQLRGIFQDLHQEAARIKGGAPTLPLLRQRVRLPVVHQLLRAGGGGP